MISKCFHITGQMGLGKSIKTLKNEGKWGQMGSKLGLGSHLEQLWPRDRQKVEMLSSRGGQGEPQGAPIQPNVGPKACQGWQKGAQRVPSGSHFYIFVCHSFWLRFSIVFWMVLESFWEVFCIILGCHFGYCFGH